MNRFNAKSNGFSKAPQIRQIFLSIEISLTVLNSSLNGAGDHRSGSPDIINIILDDDAWCQFF